jgi:hypothetical protein
MHPHQSCKRYLFLLCLIAALTAVCGSAARGQATPVSQDNTSAVQQDKARTQPAKNPTGASTQPAAELEQKAERPVQSEPVAQAATRTKPEEQQQERKEDKKKATTRQFTALELCRP